MMDEELKSTTREEELNHLLDCMVHHTRHHNEELAELADSVKAEHPDLYALIQEACRQSEAACLSLEKALALLKA